MSEPGTVFLMYHELGRSGRPICHNEPGYARYVVPESDFQAQMKRLAIEGWRGKNVSHALQSFDGKSVCITFDDGCETDLLCAAPFLKEFSFGATFYITIDFLGKPGFLTHPQLRELSALGFEIGCHSLSHPYLTDIDGNRLREETVVAKDRLEQISGVTVDHFSCPGGRWDSRVLDAVRNAGFRTMATSRTGMNSSSTDPFQLTRVAVLNTTGSDDLGRACRGQGLGRIQLQEKAREAGKWILGNSAYDSVRNLLLGGKAK